MEEKKVIPKDRMLPKERLDTYLMGKEVDRLPCILYFENTSTFYSGVSKKAYNTSPEAIVQSEAYMIDKLHLESIDIGPGLYSIAGHLKENPSKIIDPYRDGRLPIIMSALNLAQNKYQDILPIGSGTGGSFTTAAIMLGLENLLKMLEIGPHMAESAFELATRNLLVYAKAIYKEFGIVMDVSEPLLAKGVIGEDLGLEIGMKYLRKLTTGIKNITGKAPNVHICGRSSYLWNELSQMDIGIFGPDNCEDMALLKNVVGNSLTISGNIDPLKVLRDGRVSDVYQSVETVIQKAGNSPKGLIVTGGCQIPENCPSENIKAVFDSVKLFSQDAIIGKNYK